MALDNALIKELLRQRQYWCVLEELVAQLELWGPLQLHANLMERSHRALFPSVTRSQPKQKQPPCKIKKKGYMCLVKQGLLFVCTRLFSYSSDWSSREVLSNYMLPRKYRKTSPSVCPSMQECCDH